MTHFGTKTLLREVLNLTKETLCRTLATDRGFKERVREDMLVRLLDAFVWKNQDNAEEGRLSFGYVQGMNVLAAPFLYTMPSEVEAFYAFSKFIEQCCPLYVQPTLDGVHHGLRVCDDFENAESLITIFVVARPLPRDP
jgi:cell cycle arrest protein BUB2